MPIVFDEVHADVRPDSPPAPSAPATAPAPSSDAAPVPRDPLPQAHAWAAQWLYLHERRARLSDA